MNACVAAGSGGCGDAPRRDERLAPGWVGEAVTFPVALSTVIGYQRPLQEVLPVIARAGIRTVEIATPRGHVDLHDGVKLAGIRASMDDLGLRASSLHAPCGHQVDITDPSAAARAKSFDLLERALDAAVVLGATLYVLHPGGEDASWTWDRRARLAYSGEGLLRLAERCRVLGLRLAVETPLPALLGGEPADLPHVMNELPDDVGICLDTCHASLGGAISQILAGLGHRIVHVQASDTRGHADDHVAPGLGVIHWKQLIGGLDLVQFHGLMVLEVAGHGSAEVDVSACIERARRTLPQLAW